MFDVKRIILNLIPMLLSLSVHEFCHALAADRLGDQTPRREGRLTLSPLAHYDVLGTFIVPAVATVMGGFALIGWARPVRVVPVNLTRRLSMYQGTSIVAAAGPLSNLTLAVLSAGVLGFLAWIQPSRVAGGAAGDLLAAMVQVNVGLFVFNLIPLPPLDGSHLLPRSLDEFKESVAPYSIFIILILLNIPVLRVYLFELPVETATALIWTVFGLRA